MTEFSPSQYWSSLNFVTEFFSVKKFCDRFIFRQKILSQIFDGNQSKYCDINNLRHKKFSDGKGVSVTKL